MSIYEELARNRAYFERKRQKKESTPEKPPLPVKASAFTVKEPFAQQVSSTRESVSVARWEPPARTEKTPEVPPEPVLAQRPAATAWEQPEPARYSLDYLGEQEPRTIQAVTMPYTQVPEAPPVFAKIPEITFPEPAKAAEITAAADPLEALAHRMRTQARLHPADMEEDTRYG